MWKLTWRGQLQADNGRVMQISVSSLCRCTTVRQLKLPVKASLPRSAYRSLTVLQTMKIYFDSSQLALKELHALGLSAPLLHKCTIDLGNRRHEFSPV